MLQKTNLFLALLLYFIQPADAHRLDLFAYPVGQEMQVESYFGRGDPCRDCVVEVFDANGNLVNSGKTDDEGLWKFTPGKRETLRVVVKAGEGHQGEYEIPVEELPGSSEVKSAAPAAGKSAANEVSSSDDLPLPEKGIVLSAAELEEVVDRLLDEKLTPIHRSLKLAEIDKPGLTEMLGGIGYILGIFGTAMYFLSRSRKRE